MTRKSKTPEGLWIDATHQQLADLRKWIQSRMKQRHADSISAWLLSLRTDEPAEPHKRQLAFFRRILDQYGPPRAAIADEDSPEADTDTDTDTDTVTAEPPSDDPDDTDDPDAPESASAQPAGRVHRA